MKLFDSDGNEFDLKQFKKGSLVVAQVKKEMTNEEFGNFVKAQKFLDGEFNKRAVTLVFSPHWIELKEIKPDGTV